MNYLMYFVLGAILDQDDLARGLFFLMICKPVVLLPMPNADSLIQKI